MKAIVQNDYGSADVLSIKDVVMPEVGEKDVMVRVHATGLNAGDYFSMSGTPFMIRFSVGFPKPKDYVLGWDIAGVVESVGDKVTRFKSGEEVYTSCSSALAEYVRVPEDQLALKPSNLTFEQAAAVPTAALTALIGLRDVGNLQPGQKVLINGASGAVGTFAVQIAKSLGADVTGVCSTRNLDMVRSIGADQVIDYTQEDFTQSEGRYDLIFDAVRKSSFSDCKRALVPQGIYVTTAASPTLLLQQQWISMTGSQKMVPMAFSRPSKKDLQDLKELLETGKIKPVIDRSYTLSEVPEALRYYGKGHTQGKVVISVCGGG